MLTTAASRPAASSGAAARTVRTTPKKLTSNSRCHCSSVKSRLVAAGSLAPTLFTSRSRDPYDDATAATSRSGPRGSARSTAKCSTSYSFISSFSSGVVPRAATATRAPSFASAVATARPMPLLPPVTSAVLFVRFSSMLLACSGPGEIAGGNRTSRRSPPRSLGDGHGRVADRGADRALGRRPARAGSGLHRPLRTAGSRRPGGRPGEAGAVAGRAVPRGLRRLVGVADPARAVRGTVAGAADARRAAAHRMPASTCASPARRRPRCGWNRRWVRG